ncbi:MAG: porin [Gammaproteobacteria bacterium]|nr:porin [Gammaproteobacteria bacterium]MCW9006149.1 porin [Gammaproteobacteria bacterium]
MKKQILAIAIAAGLATPFMAQAEGTAYGRLHISLDNVEVGAADAEFNFADRKSAFGYKGKEDLGGGLTALAKVEWSFDPADGGAIGTRDRWIGLKKAGMGTFKFGTMSTNWKQTTGKMDPFWHTGAEGRGVIGINSSMLAGGLGDDRGRATNLFQFNMAPMGGMSIVANVELSGDGEMNTGFGVRYSAKGLYVFADMIKIANAADAGSAAVTTTDSAGDTVTLEAAVAPTAAWDESATKFGAKYTMDKITAGITIEQTEDLVGEDYMSLMATYKLNDNDTIAFVYGTADNLTDTNDSNGMALGYIHGMSKRTAMYAAYIDRSYDGAAKSASSDVSGFSLGLKHSF